MIRISYKSLFNLKLSATYHFGKEIFNDLELVPTLQCTRLFSTYKLLWKKAANGLGVFYETDAPGSIAPRYPIPQPENFFFILRVADPTFWMYADVQNWKKDMVYFLSNPSFNQTSNVVISNAPLVNPIRFYPMQFRYEVTLQATAGLTEIRDASGTLLKTSIVRPLEPTDPVGTKESILHDLSGFPEGLYQLRYVNSGGTTNENIFCSPDFTPDALGIVQMKYRTGAWTGSNPQQQYRIIINNRKSDWIYDIHVRKGTTLNILANDLKIQHAPAGEPPIVFNVVPGSIPATNDFVKFQSTAPVDHWQRPIQLKLTNIANTKTYMDPLPLPSPYAVEFTAGVLTTRVIVNV